MEKRQNEKKSLGKVIDEVIGSLKHLEGNDQVIAITTVCEYLKIRVPSVPEQAGIKQLEIKPLSPVVPQTPRVVDIKTLKEEKQPSSAIEMAALVAYYLAELAPEQERKSEVDADDMVKYFKQAKFDLPSKPQYLLPNARGAGYFDSTGRGKYKLNPVGYNLVAHNLPRSKSNILQRTKRVRKKSKSKIKKNK